MIPDGDRLVKGLTGTSVIEGGLTGFGKSGLLQEGSNLLFIGAVKNRRCHMKTFAKIVDKRLSSSRWHP